MAFMDTTKKIIRKVDSYSPYPIFYPFLMTKEEKSLFDSCIGKSDCYLEFGMGGSTIRAIRKSNAKIYSVESSPDWVNYLQTYTVIRKVENKRLFLFPVDIGPITGCGYPESDNDKEALTSYSSQIFESIDPKAIDLVLIDGRFRVACTLKVISECRNNKNLNILIHDFWDRKPYHVVLKYLDTVEKVETMGLFRIKENIDLKLLAEDYEAYKANPF